MSPDRPPSTTGPKKYSGTWLKRKEAAGHPKDKMHPSFPEMHGINKLQDLEKIALPSVCYLAETLRSGSIAVGISCLPWGFASLIEMGPLIMARRTPSTVNVKQ